jgi:hypothetical protein
MNANEKFLKENPNFAKIINKIKKRIKLKNPIKLKKIIKKLKKGKLKKSKLNRFTYIKIYFTFIFIL